MSRARHTSQQVDTRGTILCVGMCVLDIIHVCDQFPEEDSDKRCADGYWQRGGNASNNCTVLRKLGADCEFLGMLTLSPAFSFLVKDCEERQIATKNCPYADNDPPFSSIILNKETGSRTIIHSNKLYPPLLFEHFQQLNLNDSYSWIHFEARCPDETLRMIQRVQLHNGKSERRIIISLDLEQISPGNLELAEFVDYVFLGKDFARSIGWETARSAVFGLREKLKPQLLAGNRKPAIICPWGASGCVCLDSEDRYANVAGVHADVVVDSLGAGDTFCAATIYALSYLEMPLGKAVDFGNQCAGFKIRHRGYDAIEHFQYRTES